MEHSRKEKPVSPSHLHMTLTQEGLGPRPTKNHHLQLWDTLQKQLKEKALRCVLLHACNPSILGG